MGKKSRAERRHHHHRMINHVKKTFDWLSIKYGWTQEEIDRKALKLAETRKPCSCHMCGNPRRMFKDKTIQEKRFEEYGNDE